MTSDEFATRFLEEEKVAAVPGTAFGNSGEGFLRISYCVKTEQVERALPLFEKLAKEYGK